MVLTRLPYSVPPSELIKKLEERSAIIIEGIQLSGGVEELVRLAEQLGRISRTGIGPHSNAEAGLVHRVEPLYPPKHDPYGKVVRSSTCQALDGHTDDYFSAKPVDTVMLLCCEPGSGGDSTIATLDDVLSELDTQTMQLLCQPLFPAPHGHVAIVNECGPRATIRFNSYEIEKMEASGKSVPREGRRAMDNLQVAIRSATKRFPLRRGDCLIIDNHRVLHGRTAIHPGRPRLLRRIRLSRHETRA